MRYHKISRYDTIRYDTIRKCFTVCKNRMLSVANYSYIRTHVQQQAGNSAQHWSTVVLPINTVAAAGAGRRSRRPVNGDTTVGGQPVSLKSRVIQQGYYEYWPPNISTVETLHSCYCLAAARLKYLAIAQSLNI